jgi:hypothetical protein
LIFVYSVCLLSFTANDQVHTCRMGLQRLQ